MTEFFSPGPMLSLAMLGAAALIYGGIRIIKQSKDRRRGILMLVAAAVLVMNVLLIAWPT